MFSYWRDHELVGDGGDGSENVTSASIIVINGVVHTSAMIDWSGWREA